MDRFSETSPITDAIAHSTPRERCANCGPRIAHSWFDLAEFTTEDGETLVLCQDCAAEEARIEREALALARRPIACDERAGLIDAAETTRGLANALKAHELSCRRCGPELARLAPGRETRVVIARTLPVLALA